MCVYSQFIYWIKSLASRNSVRWSQLATTCACNHACYVYVIWNITEQGCWISTLITNLDWFNTWMVYMPFLLQHKAIKDPYSCVTKAATAWRQQKCEATTHSLHYNSYIELVTIICSLHYNSYHFCRLWNAMQNPYLLSRFLWMRPYCCLSVPLPHFWCSSALMSLREYWLKLIVWRKA